MLTCTCLFFMLSSERERGEERAGRESGRAPDGTGCSLARLPVTVLSVASASAAEPHLRFFIAPNPSSSRD